VLGGTPRSTPTRRRLVTLAATATALTALGASATQASATPTARPIHLALRFAHVPAKSTAAAAPGVAAAVNLTTFTSSFTTAGTKFTYTMVGTAPGGAAATTTIANSLTPVTFKFTKGSKAVPAATVTTLRNSGIYTAKAFPGGTGQFGEIFHRTNFWTAINKGAKNWHVKLAAPTVRPTLTMTVPATAGNIASLAGVAAGWVDINWFDANIQNYVTAPAGNVFTQLLSQNVVFCDGPPDLVNFTNCGIGGYHSMTQTATGKHTYAYNGWLPTAIFGVNAGNTAVISHEVAEWYDDPYVNNTAPFWHSPISPQYPCNNALETGDPLVGVVKTVGGLKFQDEAFLPFFSRQAPSTSWLGQYSWFKGFTTPSPSCVPVP
jgi:hypothetical protein